MTAVGRQCRSRHSIEQIRDLLRKTTFDRITARRRWRTSIIVKKKTVQILIGTAPVPAYNRQIIVIVCCMESENCTNAHKPLLMSLTILFFDFSFRVMDKKPG